MKVEIFGDGCRKCLQLEERTRQAIAETGRETQLITSNDPERIAAYGLLALPGLVIDGRVVASGTTLSVARIRRLLTD